MSSYPSVPSKNHSFSIKFPVTYHPFRKKKQGLPCSSKSSSGIPDPSLPFSLGRLVFGLRPWHLRLLGFWKLPGPRKAGSKHIIETHARTMRMVSSVEINPSVLLACETVLIYRRHTGEAIFRFQQENWSFNGHKY